ncbi:glycosyltransferase family 2 protein [Nakamurella antarctica]|uniref:glycosyltransferase family 2 protein n=1 Tax=Nakamurella antarctica TaxID=1902245 RepID=UPI0019CFCF11|nr:glycosyltransferase family 2 protein [Nakamurella antarctica]
MNPATVTVVVVTFRAKAMIADCLDSLAAQDLPHELLVVDNASSDGTADVLRSKYPGVRVITLAENRGFAGGLSAALAHIESPYVALLNDDAVAEPGWLSQLLAVCESDERIGAATSKMILETGFPGEEVLNNIGVALTRHGYGFDVGLGLPASSAYTEVTEVFGFSGGAALIRTESLRAAGGCPEHFFLYYEDVDMSWRLRLSGFAVMSVPGAIAHHRHSATSDQNSEIFHRHNERNRLLTLIRCAPAGFAASEVLRFGLTTISLAVTKVIRRPVPPALNFRIRLRVGVLAEVARLLPSECVARRRIGRTAVVSRRSVTSAWVGAKPLD